MSSYESTEAINISERFYIHCGDDINKQLMDTESDFNIHVEEIGSDEELIRLCNRLNKQQATINKLEQENRQLRQFINKGRRLSVKELIDNTNENELLKKKIKELEKENKKLQTELDSFRPVLFHDMRIGTITLYSKGGIDE